MDEVSTLEVVEETFVDEAVPDSPHPAKAKHIIAAKSSAKNFFINISPSWKLYAGQSILTRIPI
ncbi:protein of unknown function [Ruminococcaceae bacterium BL-4]|nr:protein of unknown function [Ruminococcaceae bacterium BL-4]